MDDLPPRFSRLARRAPGLLVVMWLLTLGGCAGNPNEQMVKFDSTPSGATVKVDGTGIGTTPMAAMLGRRRQSTVTFEKPGFAPVTVVVNPRGADLHPNPAKAMLLPENMPTTRGPNPAEELAQHVRIVDHLLATGQISPQDRDYIIQVLTRFYHQPATTP